MELRTHSELTTAYVRELRVWHTRVAEVARLREEAAAAEAERLASLPIWRRWLEQALGKGSSMAPPPTVAATRGREQIHEIQIDAIPRKEQSQARQTQDAVHARGDAGGPGCSSGGSGTGCSSGGSGTGCSSGGGGGGGHSSSSDSGRSNGSFSGGCSSVPLGSGASSSPSANAFPSPPPEPSSLTTPRGGEPPAEDARAPPTLSDLSEEERRHPFWVSGLGSTLLQQSRDQRTIGGPTGRGEFEEPAAATTGPRAAVGGVGGSGVSARAVGSAGVAASSTAEAVAASVDALAWPEPPLPPPPPPRGLFVHGDVGAGKTLLMDLFADAVASDMRAARQRATAEGSVSAEATAAAAEATAAAVSGGLQVRRVHLNAFLQECHKRLHSHSTAISEQLKWDRSRQRASIAAAVGAGAAASDPSTPTTAPSTAPATAPATAAATAPTKPTTARSRPWDVVAELVRRLVADPAAPERHEDFHAALDTISASIVRAGEGGGGSGDGALAAPVGSTVYPSGTGESASAQATAALDGATCDALVDDPSGRPVSCGVLCFDEVHARGEPMAKSPLMTPLIADAPEEPWMTLIIRTPQIADAPDCGCP